MGRGLPVPIETRDAATLYNDAGFQVALVHETKPRNILGLTLTLAHQGQRATLTGTTAETIMAAVPIPAGLIGPRGALRVLWTVTADASNANAKDFRLRLTPDGNLAGSLQIGMTNLVSQRASRMMHSLHQRAPGLCFTTAPTAQNGGQFVVVNTAAAEVAADLGAAQWLVFTGQLGSAADVIGLDALWVEALPGV